MMKIWVYRLNDDSEQGFSIQEQKSSKGKKVYSVWHDPYEGGEAYVTDWDYLDEFTSFEDAMSFIRETYGEVTEIDEFDEDNKNDE